MAEHKMKIKQEPKKKSKNNIANEPKRVFCKADIKKYVKAKTHLNKDGEYLYCLDLDKDEFEYFLHLLDYICKHEKLRDFPVIIQYGSKKKDCTYRVELTKEEGEIIQNYGIKMLKPYVEKVNMWHKIPDDTYLTKDEKRMRERDYEESDKLESLLLLLMEFIY